jgi:ribosome assembly protein 1
VEALYVCETNTTAEHLGHTYAVLGRRRARVLREVLHEGSGLFTILAYLPAADSFGLAEELRRSTSGVSSVQLLLSHWERLADDPFFLPTTDEEKEEFGEGNETIPQNLARRLVDKVRYHTN